MKQDSETSTVRKQGFFTRIVGGLKARFRRIFAKDDTPNIYPFF